MSPAAIESPKPSIRDRVFGPTKREQYLDAQVEAVEITLRKILTAQENNEIDGEFTGISEGLAAIDMMLDAKGWTEVFQHDDDGGLSLQQIKNASKQIRELMVGNPFVQNGSRIRTGATWGGGVEFACKIRTGTNPPIKQLPVPMQTIMEEPRNQRYIFGNDAHEELERGAFSDGTIFALGEESTKRLQRVSIHEITGDMRNPNNPEEILAYRRTWYQNPYGEDERAKKKMIRWYYTDLTPIAERAPQLNFKEKNEQVEVGYTLLDKAFNRQVGWAYGVPDALAIVAWSRLYKEFLTNGYVMSRSLARLAFKVTVSSTTGGNNAATSIAMPGQAGGVATEGLGNTLQSIATAGKGYDFGSGSPLAAAMAAGLGISLLALTANPSAASGSNAAAQTLSPVERATATMRRKSWDDFYLRLFRWMGMTQKLVTTWSELTDDQVQRIMQALTLLDQLEVVGADVLQRQSAKALNISDPGSVPAGWKPFSQRKAATPSIAGGGGATGGSGQGENPPTGDTGNDHGTDSTK